ncbi:MAG: hypothetical protein MUC65_08310, partial [Pontiellaceae bacterium]|nr:hypothetical protein [Pontiellaceae bacterium]
MKMKRLWIAAFALTAGNLIAAVTLDFNVASNFTGATRLYAGIGQTLTFDFTLDGAGNVTLNASTGSTVPDVISTVNSWDGAAGTVSNPALFGKTFTLTAFAKKTAAAANMTFDGADTGGL